ncbi:MAG: formate dehydrogenase accessory sulfurtransferase FdhD [Egibacteraceae bacterium]
MRSRVVARRTVARVQDGRARLFSDQLAAEEPLEIRVNGDAVSVTMRTPGDDFDLALGFCVTEGILAGPEEVAAIRYCAGQPGPYTGEFNVVDIATHSAAPVADQLKRNVFTSSSCGLCGTASIESVRKRAEPVTDDPVRIDAATLLSLPARLREAQRVFERTGGLHAAALFTPAGDLRCLREDVGRHNAVDKVIGWAATSRALPLSGHVLMVSGRVAFEIAQKALIARIPIIAAVSAPSSLAAELCDEAGMTLAGFVRGTCMNIYAGADRVIL